MGKKKALIALALAVATLAFAWRLWPHSLGDILESGDEPYGAISVRVTEFGAPDGSLSMESYKLDAASLEDGRYWEILSIVEGSKFRSDFRNLMPWGVDTVSSGPENIVYSASIVFADAEGNWARHITFHGDRKVSVRNGGDSGLLVFHPTDRDMLGQLVAYVKENGSPSQPSNLND